jgi:hypothetical protein
VVGKGSREVGSAAGGQALFIAGFQLRVRVRLRQGGAGRLGLGRCGKRLGVASRSGLTAAPSQTVTALWRAGCDAASRTSGSCHCSCDGTVEPAGEGDTGKQAAAAVHACGVGRGRQRAHIVTAIFPTSTAVTRACRSSRLAGPSLWDGTRDCRDIVRGRILCWTQGKLEIGPG